MTVEHIEERNGGLYVKGKRVSLDSIVYAFQNGESPESIREAFPVLTLADVYGAISYYLDHPDEMKAYLERQQQRWQELQATHPMPESFLKRLEDHRKSLAASPST
ncbi:hypothetical protein F183_A46950 [Bryobacterales bacterium F-183]|nr:hypothetical protein F183_A46950 [Bryobacterales bacterium F-183]